MGLLLGGCLGGASLLAWQHPGVVGRAELPATAAVGQALGLRVPVAPGPGGCWAALELEASADASDRSLLLRPRARAMAGPWNGPCPTQGEAVATLTLPVPGGWLGLVWDGGAFAYDERFSPFVAVEPAVSEPVALQ